MKKIIVANWKCNPQTLREAQRMFLALKQGIGKRIKDEIVVCPPFVYLAEAVKVFQGSKINVGAQDCFWENQGAYTGEIAASMLKSAKVKYVILGHSERRAMGENNEIIVKKIKAVLKNNLTPIVCLGETAQQKEKGETFVVLEKEVKALFGGLASVQIRKMIIVYEPIWAISTTVKGRVCSSDEALTAILFLRKLLAKMAGPKAGQSLPILYGGSVDSENANDYLRSEAISGLLVGGVSLNIKEFLKIFENNV